MIVEGKLGPWLQDFDHRRPFRGGPDQVPLEQQKFTSNRRSEMRKGDCRERTSRSQVELVRKPIGEVRTARS